MTGFIEITMGSEKSYIYFQEGNIIGTSSSWNKRRFIQGDSEVSAIIKRIENAIFNVYKVEEKAEMNLDKLLEELDKIPDEILSKEEMERKIKDLKKQLEKVNQILKEQGEFIFCYEANRFDEIVKTLPKPLKIIDVQFVYPKKGKFSNLVMIRAKRHSKSVIKFHTPIFNFEGDKFSEEAKQIYKKANTKSVKDE